jgi:hypothetical protein
MVLVIQGPQVPDQPRLHSEIPRKKEFLQLIDKKVRNPRHTNANMHIKKILNIIRQGDANQNHNKKPFNTYKDDYYQKMKNCWQGCREIAKMVNCWWGYIMGQYLWKTVWWLL